MSYDSYYMALYIYIYIASVQLLASVYQPFPVRLLRHVFWSRCCVGSAISLNSIKGGAHTCFMDVWILMNLWSANEPRPLRKFSVTALRRQKCDWNWNNLQFLHGLPHIHSSIITNLPTSCLRQHTGFSYQANSLDSIDSTSRSPAKNITGLLC